jgi:hypothetical protein
MNIVNSLSSQNTMFHLHQDVDQKHDIGAMFTAIGSGVGAGAAGGAAGGATGGALFGGVGAGPGAAVGAFSGGFGGLISGLITGINLMNTTIETKTETTKINISSNLTSQNSDINLTSNANQTVSTAKNNDVNIIASNITAKNNINIDANGEELNIKSANNTITTTQTYERHAADLGKLATEQAIVNGATGFIGGFLGAGLTNIAGQFKNTFILGEAIDGSLATKIALEYPDFAKFLALGDFIIEIPLSKIPLLALTDNLHLFPIAIGTKLILIEPIAIVNEHIVSDIVGDAEGIINNSNSNTQNIGTVNSNLNGNLVLK